MVRATRRRGRMAEMRKMETQLQPEPSRPGRLRQGMPGQRVGRRILLLRLIKIWRKRNPRPNRGPRQGRQSLSTPPHDLRNLKPPHVKMQPGRNRRLRNQQSLSTQPHDLRKLSLLQHRTKMWAGLKRRRPRSLNRPTLNTQLHDLRRPSRQRRNMRSRGLS